jgi:hypothetical protein
LSIADFLWTQLWIDCWFLVYQNNKKAITMIEFTARPMGLLFANGIKEPSHLGKCTYHWQQN